MASTIVREQKDYLTTLAPELQHMIFDYLLPSHEPDKAFEDAETTTTEKKGKKPNVHPLDYLAATSKGMRDEVNEWALRSLAKWREITKYKPLKTAGRQAKRNFLRGRNGLLTWADKHCVFCGNKSSRSAILMNGLRCCKTCDREHWPDKITKTEARMHYDLKDEHLLPESVVSPTSAKLLHEYPGLPRVRYGTYITSNVPTTMFLRKDVEALAKLAHGDLKAHLAKRQADRDERRKKAKELKARKDAEAEAEKAKLKKDEQKEALWVSQHKEYFNTDESKDGPTPLSQLISKSPTPETADGKKTRKHRKTLSVDSNAANEGRVIKPDNPRHLPVSSPYPVGEGRVPPPNFIDWNNFATLLGCSDEQWAEWNALYTPTPTPGTKAKQFETERMEREKLRAVEKQEVVEEELSDDDDQDDDEEYDEEDADDGQNANFFPQFPGWANMQAVLNGESWADVW